ncbi:MAG: hypothetical protein U0K65_06610 [Negativibacillus sp.]|nr:hypothetical protein [Negativibacillus sp.]
MKRTLFDSSRRPVRLTAWVMSVLLILTTLTGCQQEARTPTDQHFSQVEYQRPDGQSVVQLIGKAQQQAQDDLLPLGLLHSLRKIGDATEDYYSMMTIAQIRNYADVNDTFYSAEMEYLDTWDARIQSEYNQLFKMIQQSRFQSMTREIYGSSGAEDMQMSAQSSSKEILSLQEQEKKLEAQYYYEYAQATVTTPEGEVLFSSLEPQGQTAYYSQFIDRYNQTLGELYLELVSLRDQMAQLLGYDSYTEVADLNMHRSSYTREQIQQFRELLKQTLVPVYGGYLEDFYRRAENQTSAGYVYLMGEPSPTPQGDWKDTLERFSQVFSKMALETGECYEYLFSHGFIDAQPSQTKANVTFSTLIYSLNTPFLFANMDGSENDVYSISHEFGHCFAIWEQLKRGSRSEGRSMDVCEIHSQAMQMMVLPYYEVFYGEDADVARRYDVFTIVSGILTAALNDEFQEQIYRQPQMTVEQLNELYLELALEYGLVVESPYSDLQTFSKGWFTTNQYFDTPFYAIDYSLSGCVALEFLQRSMEDSQGALDTYLVLVRQDAGYDFLTALEKTGLQSPFSEEQLVELSELLGDILQGTIKLAA